ncbi:MAG: prepilin-type N-terminal cleavage/methylation domain-containing protein [Cellvibrionaceae bacterium]
MIKTYITVATKKKPVLANGFSLIEILIVIAIIAFITSGVSLVVGGSSAKLINDQGNNLFAQMQYALDEAVMTNTTIGLLVKQQQDDAELSRQYVWQRYKGVSIRSQQERRSASDDEDSEENIQESEWENIKGYIGAGELPENLSWDIVFGEEDESLEDSLDRLFDDDEVRPPDIIFSSSGEVSDFSIVITLSEEELKDDPDAISERYKITLDELGQLSRFQVGVEEQ